MEWIEQIFNHIQMKRPKRCLFAHIGFSLVQVQQCTGSRQIGSISLWRRILAVKQPRTGPLSSLPHSALCSSLAPTFPPQRRGRAETSDQQAQPRSIGNCIGGCFLLFSSLCGCTRPVEFIQFRFTLFCSNTPRWFFLLSHPNSLLPRACGSAFGLCRLSGTAAAEALG